MAENKEKVLEVKDLTISFKTDRGIVHAVRGVSFDLYKGETLCIVGESGSGKSVTNKAIMGISAKNAIIENGSILYEGEDLVKVSEEEFHRIRGHKIGMIFQDPLSALNPVMKIGKQIIEATMINKNILKKKYNDLISKELVAFRNNEANYNFNISKIDNELERNKNLKVKFESLNKDVLKLQNKISALESKNNEKLNEKINSLKSDLEELIKSRDKFINSCFEIAINLKREHQEKVSSIGNDIVKHEKDDSSSEAKTVIKELILTSLKNELEFYNTKIVYKLNDESIEKFFEDLEERNKSLIEIKSLYKKSFKELNKPLKEDLNNTKRKAKKEVADYYESLKNEFTLKNSELKEKLSSKKLELNEYFNSLDEDKKKEISEILIKNKVLQKQIDKENKKYHDVNVSKVSNVNKIELIEIKDEHYISLVNEIKNFEKEILVLKEGFINKTKITK